MHALRYLASQAGQAAEELQMLGHRQAMIRRSARNGTVLGPIDPKSKIY